jgi:3-hydroxyisobutyrate dehydrogenase-like beta-hydroxyacid dehydrogenase
MTAVVTVGLVGLGSMGMPIARRLVDAGHDVHAWARRPDVLDRAVALGAHPAPSLAALAAACDVVVVNVFSDDQLRDVALRDGGIVANLGAGAVLVNHATVHPQTVRDISTAASTAGAEVVDAAMSGGPNDIDAGRLVLLVGSSDAAFERVRPLLAAYADPIQRVGAPGDAQVVKLLNNALFGAHAALVRQIEQSARDLGADPRLVLPAIALCSGNSYVLGVANAMGSARALVDAARKYIEKDVAVCAEVATALGVDLDVVLETARRL